METQTGLGMATISSGEMAIAAMAAGAKAMVEAKFVIALKNPRSIAQSRNNILEACKRRGFAEAARYAKPVGGGKTIDGFSIRFAETAIQAMKNIDIQEVVTFEDDDRRTVKITVTDLEANISYGKDVTVTKTVERRQLKAGQKARSERTNSYGEKTFLVDATEDEVAIKIAAQASKIIRNCGLRLVPADILEEAEQAILETIQNGGEDPKAATKKVCDAFSTINITPADIEKYLRHPIATISPKELVDLRAIYRAIKDGEANWSDYLTFDDTKTSEGNAKPLFKDKKAKAAPVSPVEEGASEFAPVEQKPAQESAKAPEPVETPKDEESPVLAMLREKLKEANATEADLISWFEQADKIPEGKHKTLADIANSSDVSALNIAVNKWSLIARSIGK